jgi:hypothetical protein
MARGQCAFAGCALGIREGTAVSGETFVKLIFTVFAIAVVLAVVWAVLWILSARTNG